MAQQIIWSPEAAADLKEIRTYIARDSERYAAAVVQRIISAVERVGDFPRMGRRVPELNDETIREVIVGNYRAIYRIRSNAVDIAAVIHGARDLDLALRDREI